MVERLCTGIPGFDKLIEGGLPKSSITLISGTPGTGKSIFCAQMLYANALKGRKCLYLNLEQNEGRLENQMEQFGWDLKKVGKNLKIAAVDSADPDLVEAVLTEIQKLNYDFIALDSLDSISTNPVSLDEIDKLSLEKIAESVVPIALDVPNIGRLKLKRIFSAIARSKATAVLTSEKVEGAQGISRDTISEFLCDSILVLHAVEGEEGFRTLNIPKARMTKQKSGIYSFEIGKNGITVKSEDA